MSTALHATCVADTGDDFNRSSNDRDVSTAKRSSVAGKTPNFFREGQFSPDGTAIVTSNDDQRLRTFVLPQDLLEVDTGIKHLKSYNHFTPPSPIHSYALYPGFSLSDPSTTVALVASMDQPITLRNVLDYSTVHARYSTMSPTTEQFIPSYSLAFTLDGSHFVAGGLNQISVFDASRDYSSPVATFKTAPGRAARKYFGGASMSCKGIINALALKPDGVLAAGSLAREVGLYSNSGRGECITTFTVAGGGKAGQGITSLRWSPDGMYLLAAERQSDGIHVFDVRNLRINLTWLSGRTANTTQRLGMEIVPTVEGYEVWAGGTDGSVRMWSNPERTTGEHEADATLKLHEDAIASAIWHPGGAVLATCSGSRPVVSEFDDIPDAEDPAANEAAEIGRPPLPKSDSKLAVWTVQ